MPGTIRLTSDGTPVIVWSARVGGTSNATGAFVTDEFGRVPGFADASYFGLEVDVHIPPADLVTVLLGGPPGPTGPLGDPGVGANWRGIYNAGTTYALRDGVDDGAGGLFISNVNGNIGNAPDTHNTGDGSGTQWTALPNLAIGRARTITSAAALAATDRVVLADATGSPRPASLSMAAQAGGAFAAGDYAWGVTATGGPTGESLPAIITTPFGTPLSLNQKVVLTWPAAAGATGYNIYRVSLNYSNPMGTPLGLVASVGAVTTYTDTGTAIGAQHPPGANGGAFPLTLPSAASFSSLLLIDAVGLTPNLVTVTPSGGETIDGAASLALGPSAPLLAATLASDGVSKWKIVSTKPNAPQLSQAANVFATACPAGVSTPIAVLPVPTLVPDATRLRFDLSTDLTPGAGCTGFYVIVDETADLAGTTFINSFAFWTPQDFAVGEIYHFAANWVYNPRYGDPQLNGGGVTYVALRIKPTGGAVSAVSCYLGVEAGPRNTTYWPHP
jgi:hypothetical protein